MLFLDGWVECLGNGFSDWGVDVWQAREVLEGTWREGFRDGFRILGMDSEGCKIVGTLVGQPDGIRGVRNLMIGLDV